jgi:hypothetical protein
MVNLKLGNFTALMLKGTFTARKKSSGPLPNLVRSLWIDRCG